MHPLYPLLECTVFRLHFCKTVNSGWQGYFRSKNARYNAGIMRFFGGHACRRSRSARYRMYIQKSNPVYRAFSHRAPIRFASSKGAAGSLYYFRASYVRARQGKIFSFFSFFSFFSQFYRRFLPNDDKKQGFIDYKKAIKSSKTPLLHRKTRKSAVFCKFFVRRGRRDVPHRPLHHETNRMTGQKRTAPYATKYMAKRNNRCVSERCDARYEAKNKKKEASFVDGAKTVR